jgi:dihydroflavonol-4-reductase
MSRKRYEITAGSTRSRGRPVTEGGVFVTGGTGVVGSAIVRHLVATGRPVRGLARSAEAAAHLRQAGAVPMSGDVLDVDSLVAAMAGCAVAYHVAGINHLCTRDPARMHQVNVEGSTNCVLAAARAGVGRIVYTSSAATLGEAKGTVGREDSPHRGWFISAYERSKFEAEQATFALAASEEVELVSLNPSSVQGPGRASGTGQVLVRYMRGRLPVWPEATISFVDIDDCATGHLLGETRGRPGERYVLNGVTLDTDGLVAAMRRVAPSVSRPKRLPVPVAAVAVAGVEAVARLRGKAPPVCRQALRALTYGHRYDGSKAERELGVRYRPAEETLQRTAAWLVDQGLVPAEAVRG